jgi:hypothetical protein
LAANTHPVAGLQLSVVQTLPSLQASAGPETQAPLLQASLTVQASPSEHVAKLLTTWQPSAGMQLSSVHGLPSLQSKAPAPEWHVPPEQTSPVVQASPSLHAPVLFV